MRFVVAGWLALLASWPVLAQSPPVAEKPASGAIGATAGPFDFHIQPFTDMHFWARRLASPRAPESPEINGLNEAIEAVRAMETEVGGGFGWGIVEAGLATCTSAEDAIRLAAELPEKSRSGRSMRLRDPASRMAAAYAVIEAEFLEKVWPSHREAIERVRADIREEFEPKAADCVADVIKHLGMRDPGQAIPVYLVAEAPFPQAFTHRRYGGGGVCFVGIGAASGTQLFETILHESIHALDVGSQNEETALQALRRGLREAGLSDDDKLFRDVPHTLMFVQAGETIRRVVDPDHRHYGDVEGYYPKVPEAARIVRAAWTEHLDGKCSRDEAVRRMAEQTIALRKP